MNVWWVAGPTVALAVVGAALVAISFMPGLLLDDNQRRTLAVGGLALIVFAAFAPFAAILLSS
jgi:hypothetical protein